MAFSASPFLQRRLGVGKGWEGTQLGKLAQTTQKILCAMEYYTQIKKKKQHKKTVGGRESSKAAIIQRLTGHQSAGGTWWAIAFATLGWWCFFSPLIFSPLFDELSLPQPTFWFFPSLPEKEGTKGAGAYLAGRVNPTTVCTWSSTWWFSTILGHASLYWTSLSYYTKLRPHVKPNLVFGRWEYKHKLMEGWRYSSKLAIHVLTLAAKQLWNC